MWGMGAQRRGVGSQLPPAPTVFNPCLVVIIYLVVTATYSTTIEIHAIMWINVTKTHDADYTLNKKEI